MLKFDRELFVQALNEGALGKRGELERVVDEISGKGFSNIFLIGSGGTVAMMYPFEYIFKSYSALPVRAEIAAELLVTDNRQLTSKSVCIFASVTGTTKETVAAAQFCREKGATTIGLVGIPGTPLAEAVDYAITFGREKHAFDVFYLQLQILTTRFLQQNGEFPQYEQFAAELAALPQGMVAAMEEFDARAEAFAIKHRETDYHMLVGAGNLWGNTYSYAMCILEEMQWIKSKSIHAAEFFHGTLELVEKDTSVILFKGEDATRPLVERVERFAENITKELFIIDTKDYALPGISEEFRKLVDLNVNWALTSRISAYLERERNHPLEIRRYYRKMEY
ncbi:SIS domain-containing protein [Ectobacillus ponti]|uniref:Fructosamine deglycase n=1 Tax=Ectobacillus ponti TaxID=2961894 RepID=A0AA42BQ80_9BACI|nr:SIS domain-containing protein [Ectobacillus ponti]MCP8970030.1 SIS domain-containing protein [Ectobacillus ponti]